MLTSAHTHTERRGESGVDVRVCVKISYASRNSFARVPFWPKFWPQLPQLPDERERERVQSSRQPLTNWPVLPTVCACGLSVCDPPCVYTGMCVCGSVRVWLGLCMIYKSSEALCLPQWPRMRCQAPSCHSHLLQLQCNSHKCGQSCHQQEFKQKLKKGFNSERIHELHKILSINWEWIWQKFSRLSA